MAKKEINARITSLRKLREYKQADVAELLGMKTSTYSQMEQRGNITAEMVIRLSELFDIDPREILYGEDYETPNPPMKKLSNREENMIKIFRTLKSAKQDDICDYILKVAKLGKYKKHLERNESLQGVSLYVMYEIQNY